ncbi:hypothetical protein M3Y98_01091300 [Aphelenchoides besseyi]|nr:hypothetical protein M3Y98_01091300 [Aphelenchoides besseyi]
MKLFVCVCLVLTVISVVDAFRQQSVGVRGKLMCGDKPLNNTLVKIWGTKNWLVDVKCPQYNDSNLGTDDQLGATQTDSDGKFELSGGVGSLLGMDVKLKVYHDCDDGITPGQRKVVWGIPSHYVTRTEKVQKFFDAGTINMELKHEGEERSLIN